VQLGDRPKLHGAKRGQAQTAPLYETLIIQTIETAHHYCYSDGEQFISVYLRLSKASYFLEISCLIPINVLSGRYKEWS